MSDKAVSSGDGCNPYSDDEDCYDEGSNNDNHKSSNGGNGNNNYNDDDDEEGSGSGDFVSTSKVGGNNKSKDSHSGKAHEDSDDEEGDNWPPWVTAKPEGDKDIVVEDPKHEASPKVTTSAGSLHLSKALLYYLIPVLTCLVGSLASW